MPSYLQAVESVIFMDKRDRFEMHKVPWTYPESLRRFPLCRTIGPLFVCVHVSWSSSSSACPVSEYGRGREYIGSQARLNTWSYGGGSYGGGSSSRRP